MDVEAVEPRPLLHVTPPAGWLNDPVGGLVHDGRQHLFFQFVPGSTRWRSDCHWAHLVGDDLVRWRHLPVALAPGDGDDGVWSGSAVVDAAGPVLLYTSVLDGGFDLGRIALARPLDGELIGWSKHVGNPVLESAGEADVIRFRDPFVWGSPGDWSMVVGAGLRDGRGAVLQYRGTELERWHFRGVLAAGSYGDGLGDTWECPQYVDLGAGERALVISVWERGAGTRVAGARGTEQAGTFLPGRWETLGHGGAAYALTTYRDRAGRLAATAWLRHEEADADAGKRVGWSGMLSLPMLLSAGVDGGLHVAPHPDVDTLRQEALDCASGTVDLTAGTVDLVARAGEPASRADDLADRTDHLAAEAYHAADRGADPGTRAHHLADRADDLAGRADDLTDRAGALAAEARVLADVVGDLASRSHVLAERASQLAAGAHQLAGRAGVPAARAGATAGVAEVTATLPSGAWLRLETADQPVLLTATDAALIVESAAGTTSVPVARDVPVALRIVVDRGAVEAWTGDGRWLALRIPFLRVRRAVLGGGGSALAAHRLEPVQAG